MDIKTDFAPCRDFAAPVHDDRPAQSVAKTLANSGDESVELLAGHLTFPYQLHAPAKLVKQSPIASITRNVREELGSPEFVSRSRPHEACAVVFVPEAALHKHDDPKSWQHDVGSTW